MIFLRNVKDFCKNYTEIENYNKAIQDKENCWICHHKQGVYMTTEELKEYGWYYDCPPECLIFVTKSEHNKLHKRHKNKKLTPEQRKRCAHKTKVQYWLGKKRGEEFSKKMSERNKGRIPWNKGLKLKDK